jgi:hypothetical protein
MIDESLVEYSLTNYWSKRRIGEKADIFEQALDPKKVLEVVNIELFSREVHFVALA